MAININELIAMANYKQKRDALAREQTKQASVDSYAKENLPYIQGLIGQESRDRGELNKDLMQFFGENPAPQGFDQKKYLDLIKGSTQAPATPSSPFFKVVDFGNKKRIYSSPTEFEEFDKGATPSSGNYGGVPQFIGRTPDGLKAIVFDPATQQVKTVPMPSKEVIPKRDKFASPAEIKDLAGTEVLKGQLDFIEEKYRSDYVGLLDQYTGAITSYFDGDEAVFRRTVKSMGDTLLRLKSGAQINEQEYARLMRIIPNEGMGEAQFKANAEDFRRELSLITDERKKAMAKGGVVEKDIGGFKYEEASDEQFDAALDALGLDATEDDIKKWMIKKYTGGE